jgi:hypothetical protein
MKCEIVHKIISKNASYPQNTEPAKRIVDFPGKNYTILNCLGTIRHMFKKMKAAGPTTAGVFELTYQ